MDAAKKRGEEDGRRGEGKAARAALFVAAAGHEQGGTQDAQGPEELEAGRILLLDAVFLDVDAALVVEALGGFLDAAAADDAALADLELGDAGRRRAALVVHEVD